MSSSLIGLDRQDVQIVPVTAFDAADGSALIDLWNVLRQTSVDATQSSATSVWKWAESCMLLAQVRKLILPSPAPATDPFSPPIVSRKELTEPWGKVNKSWRAPAMSPSREPGANMNTTSSLAYINADFLGRVAQLPEDVGDPGALHQYSPLALKQNGTVKLYHAYLYDHILLFVVDAESSLLPVSPDTPRSSPLHVLGVIHLQDIDDMGYVFVRVDDYGTCGIAVTVLMTDNMRHQFILVIPSPADFVSWSEALSLRTNTNAAWAASQSTAIARNIIALTDWPSLSAPLQDYGALLQYSPVTILVGDTIVRSGAYLFHGHLVIISMTRPGEFKVLRDIHLTEISDVHTQGSMVSLLIEGEYPEPWRANLLFQTTTRGLSTMLERQVHNLRPRPIHSASPINTIVSTWYLAGIVALSPSTDNDSEYNIAVAILPKFQGDGLATHAMAYALEIAFETLRAHRVQARVLHGAASIKTRDAACRFLHWGFTHEGTRRRVVVKPEDGGRADMSILAMLDTDWALRETKRPPKATPWDELFVRHQREREALHMAQGGVSTGAPHGPFLDVELTQSVADDLEASETASSVPSSFYTRSVVTLPISSVGTGAGTGWSSWAAVSDTPKDVQPISEQIRRWIAQQVVARGDSDVESPHGSQWNNLDEFDDAVESVKSDMSED